MITCPEPIVAFTLGDAVAIVATATDAEDDANGVALTASCQPDSTAGLPVGFSEVTCTVTDSDGNTDTCTVDITVNGALFSSTLKLDLRSGCRADAHVHLCSSLFYPPRSRGLESCAQGAVSRVDSLRSQRKWCAGCVADGPGSFGVRDITEGPLTEACFLDFAPGAVVPTLEACVEACAGFVGAFTGQRFSGAGCFFEATTAIEPGPGCFAFANFREECAAALQSQRDLPCRRTIVFQCQGEGADARVAVMLVVCAIAGAEQVIYDISISAARYSPVIRA